MKDSKPLAVLISDMHFTVPTLELASKAYVQAVDTATELNVPLLLCGDTLDGKAIIRGEVANRLLELIEYKDVKPIILVGNHDLINEKESKHCLNFLAPFSSIVQTPVYMNRIESWLIPYQTDTNISEGILKSIQAGKRIIMHQGCMGSDSGHYIQDKSALTKSSYSDFRVISGHYHTRQDIKCGRPRKGAVGLFSYVGNPYTLSFAEAKDPEKGFQILRQDGLLDFVPTNLRKHVILEYTQEELQTKLTRYPNSQDIIWVKIHGQRSVLNNLDKKVLGDQLLGHSNFKLDLICTDAQVPEIKVDSMSEHEVFDHIIDGIDDTVDQKSNLKKLWRDILQ